MRLGFSFEFRTGGLDILYNDILFDYRTLKGDLIVLDFNGNFSKISFGFISYFDSNSHFVK